VIDQSKCGHVFIPGAGQTVGSVECPACGAVKHMTKRGNKFICAIGTNERDALEIIRKYDKEAKP